MKYTVAYVGEEFSKVTGRLLKSNGIIYKGKYNSYEEAVDACKEMMDEGASWDDMGFTFIAYSQKEGKDRKACKTWSVVRI